MAKNSTSSKTTAKKVQTKSVAAKAAKNAAEKVKKSEQNGKNENNLSSVLSQLAPYLLGCLALFITVCFFLTGKVGFLGNWLNKFLLGLFAGAAYTIPLFILNIAINWRRDIEAHITKYKLIFSFICLIFIAVLLHAATTGTSRPASIQYLRESLSITLLWKNGIMLDGGGAIGGFLGSLLLRGVGTAGTFIISISALIIFGLFLFGMTPHSLLVYIAFYIHKKREEKALRVEEEKTLRRETSMRPSASSVPVSAADNPNQSGDTRTNPENIAQDPNYEPDVPLEGETKGSSPLAGLKIFGGKIDFDAEIGDSSIANIDTSDTNETENVTDSDAYNAALNNLSDNSVSNEKMNGGKKSFISPLPIRGKIVKRNGAVEKDESENPLDLKEIFRDPEDTGDIYPDSNAFPAAAEASIKMNDSSAAVKPISMTATSTQGGFVLNAQDIGGASKLKKSADAPLIDPEILKRLETSEKNLSDASLEIERRRISVTAVPNADIANENPIAPSNTTLYKLPPPSLLRSDAPPKNEDISDELQTTAKKLVDTLTSFKVRTRIVNISRGPTITRYELAPDEGVRVRAIANLVDDISLNLATIGVRIEAPIPGKSAVGIEVPNRVIATVYLRDLIENPKFKSAPSKINVSLGMDVAGEPIYLDVAKMPHLLIAGATGMGKSVCINSMIVSLLYKSTPDEVKLILVDPKKVELNIYNGLPHLLVPVVSDPKKAAGSLHWAVTEMEHRFELIEAEGVRDLKSFNAAVGAYNERFPDEPKKKLPQIVIIIDELADLMMTAPDDVEESICRLAQKARAAGMHLIIGTQRPSVDVITGLIKANIPSRIAFTVASQVDSRTIIDITGAEKLIGRGDMLYAPVGLSKPMRVQGAFVSENEIDAVTDFIKRQGVDAEYDSEVINSIEKAAEACGNSKKGAKATASLDDDGDESDPMLKPAIELAVESGKISTSLIQRRLSLGYGRAAKLIDRMEQLGFVSAPDGQKPRSVLITKQQYMEMILNKDEFD